MHNNDFTFQVTIGIGFLILIGLICFRSPIAGGDIPIGYPHQIIGTVVNAPTIRYVRSRDNGQEKVALTIQTNQVTSTLKEAYSNGQLIVECYSTRCTQIQQGEIHSFVCRGEGRLLEPNIIICKHKERLYD